MAKNHLGDRNEFLPTVHGFDEFFGNLYHLNAEEEPELPDYPKDPAFKAAVWSTRLRTRRPTKTTHPRFGPDVGKQTIVDTGPLTKKADGNHRRRDHYCCARVDGSAKNKADQRFLWYNSRPCISARVAKRTSLKLVGSVQHDRMVVHDEQIGMMLDKLDKPESPTTRSS